MSIASRLPMIENGNLRVLIISTQYPPEMGGGGSHSFYLANELARQSNVEAYVLTIATNQDEKSYECIGENLFIYRIYCRKTKSLHHNDFLTHSLKLCKRINPHIIHGQHFDGAYIGAHLKSSFNKPLVITLHKTPLLSWDPTKIETEPLYSHIKFLTQIGLIDYFVAGSIAFYEELKKISPTTKIKLIPHGIPINLFKEMAYNEEKSCAIKKKLAIKSTPKDIIVCPSRLDERRKGLEIFLKAARELQKKLPNRKITFLITGKAVSRSEKDFKKHLKQLSKFYNLERRVKFISFPFDEMPALYRISRACVLPSIAEGLGLSLIESLSVKTPVISADTIGINEVIQTNRMHGLKFQIGDHEELAKCLYTLLTDASLEKEIRKEGFNLVKKTYNAKEMAKKHIALYNELLGNHIIKKGPGIFS